MSEDNNRKKLSAGHKFGLLIAIKLLVVVVAVVFFLKHKGLI